jgi:dolichol-phosphate mannosyltransferase
VVIPVFNEEENIPEVHARLTALFEGLKLSHEIVFVDDGSSDRSVELLGAIAQRDARVAVVELSRNFGHQVAISAGLDVATGRAVAVMDADLQDPPEVLKDLLAKKAEGFDVVYAVRRQRKEPWFKRAAYALFYRLLCRVSNVNIPLDAGDFCVMDRRIVDLLKAMPERNRFVRGIRSWVGLRQVGLPYERQARYAGRPKYTLRRLVALALDGLVSFSHAPLRVASLLGFAISGGALLLALFYFAKRLMVGLEPRGFATLIVAILFLAGIQIIAVGVVGEYVGRIFDEVKRRPLYVVRRIVRDRRENS